MNLKVKVALLSFVLLLGAINGTSTANAALGAIEDYNNERILPLFLRSGGVMPEGSGFLYSPRIVFTIAHGGVWPDMYVGKPNSSADEGTRVRVIKQFKAPEHDDNVKPIVWDFSILILESDLAPVAPAELLTPEIHTELLAANAAVKLHGYGGFEDRCSAGQRPPCTGVSSLTSKLPRMANFKLYTRSQISAITGMQVMPIFDSQLLLFGDGPKVSGCPGDSGGSLTTTYKERVIYLGPALNGEGTYSCGLPPWDIPAGGINFSSPVYRHLALIKEAESFVAERLKVEQRAAADKAAADKAAADKAAADKAAADKAAADKAAADKAAAGKAAALKKTTITCVKGKLNKKITAIKPVCPTGYKKK
jgi:hypothetical protein